MTPAFVHLRVHTEYSLVNGVVRMKPLVNACAKAGMPAVAVTDQCNLFAMVKFYTAVLEAGALAAAEGAPVGATNDVQFLKPEDFDAHEARGCIHDGRTVDDPRLV